MIPSLLMLVRIVENNVFASLLLMLIPIGADLLDLRMAQSLCARQLQTLVDRFHRVFGHHDHVVCDLGQRVGRFDGIRGVFVLSLGRDVAIVAGLLDAVNGFEAFVRVVEDLRACGGE